MINKKYLLNLGFFFLLYNTTFIDTVQAFPACDGTEDGCMVIVGKPPPEDSFTPGDGGGSSWGGGGGGNEGSGGGDSKKPITVTTKEGCNILYPTHGTAVGYGNGDNTGCKVCVGEVESLGSHTKG